MLVVVLLLSCLAVGLQDKILWDSNGYVLYCPCMGRFGNQAAHFLGALAFAKDLNRTLTLPPWRTYVRPQRNVPFKEWFIPEAVQQYHKSLPLEDFISLYGNTHWPAGERTGYCVRGIINDNDCDMKHGNPFGPFWDELGINFDRSEITQLPYDTENEWIKNQWMNRYSPIKHPVLAFKGAPASFPVKKRNLHLQQYLQWNDNIRTTANNYIYNTMGGAKYIGVHLRIGSDWSRACEHAVGMSSFMESQQCFGENTANKIITDEMCFPSTEQIISDIQSVVTATGINTVYIASDVKPDLNKLQKELTEEVTLYYNDPEIPQIDLAILGMSEHFIGNCISSFSAFVSRERHLNNKMNNYWGYINIHKDEL